VTRFAVRRATVADASIIARHRAEMFSDMGQLSKELHQPLVEQTTAYLMTAIPTGEYLGWLATPPGQPESVVAGAGVQLRRVLPHPDHHRRDRLASGRQAIVLNVYTDRAWRKRGLAQLLMEEVLRWARESGLETLVLHASPEGRRLYERLGFLSTNEMRFSGDLSQNVVL
jgi:GNAT superfamily N-acetyltransferase